MAVKPLYLDWYPETHAKILRHLKALKDDPKGETDAGLAAHRWIDLGIAREDIMMHAYAANLCGRNGHVIHEDGSLQDAD